MTNWHAAVFALAMLAPPASLADTAWLADANGCKLAVDGGPARQSATWTGGCRDGFAEGRGRSELRVDGLLVSAYEGEMRSGRSSGQGVLTSPYGRRYEGGFVDGHAHGAGVLTFPRGAVYRGDFMDGKAEGACTLAWPEGHRYEGRCKAARPEGAGAVVFANGDRYVGSFALGQPAGQGRYTWANGDVYEGGFSEGEKHGLGDYRLHDGTRHTGHFERGLAVGAGHIQLDGGPSYRGPFALGSPTLSGRFANADGSVAQASEALRVQLTPRYVPEHKLPAAKRYTAAPEICLNQRPPQPPATPWAGVVRYRASVTIRDGQVQQLDITATPPVNAPLHAQFTASIERAVRAYDCPGDHVLELPFAFLYAQD